MQYFEENVPGIQMTKPDATYLLWLDCSALKLKQSPYDFFLQKAKVAFSPGASFGSESQQFIRLNFGTTRQILTESLERVKKSLQ